MINIPPILPFAEFERHAVEMLTPVFASAFGAVRIHELDQPGEQHEHLIKGILTRGEVTMLVGPSGSGKSFLATDMALSIARGEDLAPMTIGGRVTSPRVRRGGVVYVAGEGARGLKKRLRAYIKVHGLGGQDLPFILLTLPVDLHSSDEHTNKLIDECKRHEEMFRRDHDCGLELVVFDTLSASTPGANENASDDMSRLLGRSHRIARECGCAVQLVHHMNASGARERGHSSLRANVDSVIEIQKLESRDADNRYIRQAKVTKQKDGEDGIAWKFVLRGVELGQDEDGDPITSCVVAQAAGEELSAPEGSAKRPMNVKLSIALRALSAAIERAGRPAPNHVEKAPTGPYCVTLAEWRDEMALLIAGENEDPDALKERTKKARDRACDELINRNYMRKHGDWVWRTNRRAPGVDREEPKPEPASVQEQDVNLANFDW